MGKTKIEWADYTFNPWVGCTKVSPGCANCYAENLMDKRFGRVVWGKGNARQRTSEANWRKPIAWDKQAKAAGRRDKVFCASLADVFDGETPGRWLLDLLELIEKTPNLDWLLLTKRPENIQSLFDWQLIKGFADHVWLGVSVEDQQAADERIPKLLSLGMGCIKFISAEPLLGPINLRGNGGPDKDWLCDGYETNGPCGWVGMPRVDWVIVGGESGSGARPMHPDWVRSIRDQCSVARVPFFFKQWGAWKPLSMPHVDDDYRKQRKDERWLNIEGGHGFHGERVYRMRRVGKHAAGAMLDGTEYREFPRAIEVPE